MDTPTKIQSSDTADDRLPEPALPQCERLADTRADLADYPERTSDRAKVREVLNVIEDALAFDNVERIADVASLADVLQGLDTEGAQIRYERRQVEKAIGRVKDGDKTPERPAVALVIGLEASDPRYGALTVNDVRERLRRAASSSTSTGKPGRGAIGAPATLAALMAEAGAHDVETIEAAKRKIANSRGPKSSAARPSFLRSLRGLADEK